MAAEEPVLLDTGDTHQQAIRGDGICAQVEEYGDGSVGVAVRIGAMGWIVFRRSWQAATVAQEITRAIESHEAEKRALARLGR